MYYNYEYADIEDMVGKTFNSVEQRDDELHFVCDEGVYVFQHHQDCCENVYIESIVGDLHDLVGTPLLQAEKVSGETPSDFDPSMHESYTWTFYKFATIKGYVDVRWLGSSNGYYSEGVSLDFYPSKDEDDL